MRATKCFSTNPLAATTNSAEPSLVQAKYAVHLCGKTFIVRRYDGRRAFAPHQRHEFAKHHISRMFIEISGGLVGQYQLGPVGQSAGNRHALLLAA